MTPQARSLPAVARSTQDGVTRRGQLQALAEEEPYVRSLIIGRLDAEPLVRGEKGGTVGAFVPFSVGGSGRTPVFEKGKCEDLV